MAMIGGGFTLLYLVAIAILFTNRWSDVQKLPLNELGDCLAGIFGPLAILWLVLGFFQQGIELRQNSDALLMQAQELKNSVEQQAELVKVAQAQLDSDKSVLEHQHKLLEEKEKEATRVAQPLFEFRGAGSHGVAKSVHSIYIANYGAVCRNISLSTLNSEWDFTPNQYPILEQGHQSLKFSVELPVSHKEPFFSAELTFLDARGNMQRIPCRGILEPAPGGIYRSMRIEQ